MYPNKNIFESNEMNRLFSRSIETDAVPLYSLFQSPVANRSSSSADSVSPESFLEIPLQYHNAPIGRSRVTPSPNPTVSSLNDLFESPVERNLMYANSPQPLNRSSQMYESPRSFNAYRPIVGRKILGASQVRKDETDLFHDWTPPSSQPKSYELFPKSESHMIPTISPTFHPTFVPQSPSIRTTYVTTGRTHPNYHNSTYKDFRVPQSKSQFARPICTFCRKNGERPSVYEDHSVKEKIGGKYIVTCPILRSHRCQECGASGDDAHTLTYCPVLRSNNNGKPLVSTTVKLKNTPIKSNGKRRYAGQIVRM